MCGRYYFCPEKLPAFHTLKKKIEQQQLFEYASDEVFPSQQALVMIADGDDYALQVMKWGIAGYKGNLLINARCETIEEKPTFQPMLSKRCLIPCNGFFEWVTTGGTKHKMYIRKKGKAVSYLAGIFNSQDEFVIVTGEALHDMKKIHKRTPIILSEQQATRYLQGRLNFEVNNDDLLFDEVISR